MSVRFVITEHPGAITGERRRHYERIRGRLERIAGRPVRSVPYPEVENLTGAPAVVLSGSFAPWAVHEQGALDSLGEVVRAFRGPVLGICAGVQLQAVFAGGSIGPAAAPPASGYLPVQVTDASDLLSGLAPEASVYHHHSEEIRTLPDGFRVLASTPWCRVEAMADPSRGWWGTQFHPEEYSAEHPDGERVLKNFFGLALSS